MKRSALPKGRFLFCLLMIGFSLGGTSLILAEEAESTDLSDGGVRRYALFVGANDGGAERVRLRYAETDTRSLSRVMSEVGGVQPQDSRLLIDPAGQSIDVTLNEMLREVDASRREARRVEFLFYYSGHSDERGLLLGEEVYGYRQLKDKVEAIDADVTVVILDSCSSGSFTRLKGGVQQPSFLMDDSAFMSGHAYLTSSSENEASQESDRIRASFFTHNLVAGLRGAADHSGDGRVTLNEVYQYAFNETLEQTEKTHAGPQHPSYDIQLKGKGDLVLTDLNTPVSRMTLGPYVSGRLFVRSLSSPEQPLVAEVSKSPGKPMTLALSPGRYRVSMVEAGRRFTSVIEVEDFQEVTLAWAHFEEGTVENTVVRGSRPLPGASGASAESKTQDLYAPVGLYLGHEMLLPQSGQWVNDFALAALASRVRRVNVMQVSGVFSFLHEDLMGLQASGVFGMVMGRVEGFQFSGVFNYTGGEMSGFQAAGVLNVGRQVDGFQAAGTVNVAIADVNGFQVSGIYNQSRDLEGFQVGLVNVARDVEGIQVGLVNVARERNGLVLGLVNIQEDGLLHGQMWYDGAGWGYAGFQSGTRHFYTLIYGAADVIDLQQGRTADLGGGLGLGFHGDISPLFLEVDISGFTYLSSPLDLQRIQEELEAASSGETPYTSNPQTYLVLRAQAGLALDRLALFAGAMGHVVFQGQQDLLYRNWDYTYAPGGETGIKAVRTSLYAGMRF